MSIVKKYKFHLLQILIHKGYKSSNSNNRNSMSHLFSKANIDLDYDNYTNSKIDIFAEKVSMDTYLKIFEDILITENFLKMI